MYEIQITNYVIFDTAYEMNVLIFAFKTAYKYEDESKIY